MAKSFFALNRALTSEELFDCRRNLVRLGLAWLAMMQVMMFALPGYLRVEAGPNDSLEVLDWAIFLMNWASLTLTVPVMLYSAWPIWRGLVRAVQKRQINMDVPVAISMFAAFVPSTIATVTGAGEVYFDSVTMFIAFLLTARYFEKRAAQTADVAHMQRGLPQQLQQLCLPLMARADRVATIFVLAQLALSAVVTLVWWYVQPEHVLSILIALLVMSCPCALSLAAPVSLAATHATLAAHPQITPGQTAILFAHTHRITYQNLYGALAWHLLSMPLAVFGLVTPWMAALAMFISSIAVIGNAWRLYRIPSETNTFSPKQDRLPPASLV